MLKFIIVYIIADIVKVYSVYKFIHAFFNVPVVENYKEIGGYVIFCAIDILEYLLLNNSVAKLLISVIGIFGLCCCYDGKIRKKISVTLLQIEIILCIEIIVNRMFNYIGDFVDVKRYALASVYIIDGVLIYLISVLVEKYFAKKDGDNMSVSLWIVLIIFPYISLLLLISVNDNSLNTVAMMMCAISLVILNLMIIIWYDFMSSLMANKITEVQKREQINAYKAEIQILRDKVESGKAMKHDLKNHICTVKGLIEKNDCEAADRYLTRLEEILILSNSYCTSGNVYVDAIVNYKCEQAAAKQITVELDICISTDMFVDEVAITVIIGNLMDNAIRGAAECDSDRIVLRIREEIDFIIINVVNSYKTVKKDALGKYLSTKQDNDEHGIGLDNIEKIVHDYNGVLEIDTSGGMFEVTVVLYTNSI